MSEIINTNPNEEIMDTQTEDTTVTEQMQEDNYLNRNNISRYKMREQAVLLVFERLFSDTELDEIADNKAVFGSEYYLEKPNSHKAHELLHTHYSAREKFSK